MKSSRRVRYQQSMVKRYVEQASFFLSLKWKTKGVMDGENGHNENSQLT